MESSPHYLPPESAYMGLGERIVSRLGEFRVLSFSGQGGVLTEPRNHSFGDPCIFSVAG